MADQEHDFPPRHEEPRPSPFPGKKPLKPIDFTHYEEVEEEVLEHQEEEGE